MNSFNAKAPDFDFAPRPGRLIQRELDQRAISQAQLAARTGLSSKHVNQVVKGVVPLSPDVAVALEQVLGTSAETWLSLEAASQAHAARKQRSDSLEPHISWANQFPKNVLVENNIVLNSDRGIVIVEKLLKFFGVASPAAYEKTWLEPQASYKRSQLHTIDSNSTALWLRLAEKSADPLRRRAPIYDPELLERVAARIPQLTMNDPGDAFKKAQHNLLSAGVILVFVPELPNTRISGVSRRFSGVPMIAVTSRYRSLDSLWFTILHEIAHILLHPKRSTFVDHDLKADDDADAKETEANLFAQRCLIPPAYEARLLAANTVASIKSLAEDLGVAPGLVAGQWAFRTKTWGGPIARLRGKVDLSTAL